MPVIAYDRAAAVAYAHRWAYGRNPAYANFDAMGGDCTNFASQCLYAGSGVMDFLATFGWYYRSLNDRSPSWTGVPFFYDYLVRTRTSPGPVGEDAPLSRCQPGDFVQLRFGGERFGHTPVIVATGQVPDLHNTLVAAHTFDTDYRPLDSYSFQALRCIHITQVRTPGGD
jgi:hypothetical protein